MGREAWNEATELAHPTAYKPRVKNSNMWNTDEVAASSGGAEDARAVAPERSRESKGIAVESDCSFAAIILLPASPGSDAPEFALAISVDSSDTSIATGYICVGARDVSAGNSTSAGTLSTGLQVCGLSVTEVPRSSISHGSKVEDSQPGK